MAEHIGGQAVGTTIGVDVGDRYSQVCVIDASGERTEEARLRTEERALRGFFAGREPARVVMETGTHATWMSQLLGSLGHEVVVANARRVQLIAQSDTKSDRIDAETLARLGRMDRSLLRPVRPRRAETLADREVLRARDVLVRARAQLANHVRSAVKVMGARLPRSAPASLANQASGSLPANLRPALEPLLQLMRTLTKAIGDYERVLEALADAKYPQTACLRQVAGVGVVTSLAYVLTIEDPHRFPQSRAVGSYLGLRPRRDQSGDRDPQLRITKAGDGELRRLLVQSAHYILGPFGPDTDLRRFGVRLAARGGKAAKKRAIVAVARKLAVLLHRLWVTGEEYQPLRVAALPSDLDATAGATG
jgi:transposase